MAQQVSKIFGMQKSLHWNGLVGTARNFCNVESTIIKMKSDHIEKFHPFLVGTHLILFKNTMLRAI